MKFSTELPPNCPPSSCVPASGKVFRIVENDPPKRDDFRSMRELNPNKPYTNECMACGLSVYRDKSDVYKMIRRIPGFQKRVQKRVQKRMHMIASGTLNETLGVIVHTPNGNEDSHHTWWMYFECSAWEVFAVIEPIQL